MLTVHANPQPAARPESAAPPELFVCPWTLAVDTREQAPWGMTGLILNGQHVVLKRERVTLQTGDYSIVGLEGQICCERKSSDDLIGSVCGGHKRLKAEHERMLSIVEAGGMACLIVEGSFSEIDDRLRLEGRDKAAETLLGTVASWPFKFRVNWFFAGDRRHAEVLAFRILCRVWRKMQEKESDG